MSPAEDWAAETVADWEQRAPEVLDLAAAVSLASRVEPILLRRARLELCPWIHAGAEADLWYSSLVQAQSPKALVLAPAVAQLLQLRLLHPEHRPGLQEAWSLLRDVHAEAPEFIRLEEEVIWRALVNPGDPQIPILLQSALRSLLDGDRPELAEWASRSLSRFPAAVRSLPDAWFLAFAAGVRLGGLNLLKEPLPDHLPHDALFWIAAQSAGRQPLHLAWRNGEILLSLTSLKEIASPASLPVPRSNPILLEAILDRDESRLLTLRPEAPELVSLPLERGSLRLRTAAGEIYRIEVLHGLVVGIMALAVLDHRRVISASGHGALSLWDLESGDLLSTFEGHRGPVRAIAVLDSRHIVSGSSDRTLRVWDMESGRVLQVLEGHSGEVSSVAVLSRQRIVSGSLDRTLRVWDLESGQTLQTLEGHSNEVRAVATLDGSRIVSGSSSGTLRVWDVESGQALRVLAGHSGEISAVAVLDSQRIISGSSDRTVRVWDVEVGKALQILEGHSNEVTGLAVLEGGRIVSASLDGTLRVWDLEAGQTLATFQEPSADVEAGEMAAEHSGPVTGLAVVDGHRVVSCSSDRTLRVWSLATGEVLAGFDGHTSAVHSIAAVDGGRVLSGAADGIIFLWDLDRGEVFASFEGHSGVITALAVIDRQRFVSASSDRTLRLWDLESKRASRVLQGHSESVSSVAVVDRRWVVSASSDRMVYLWDLESGQMIDKSQYSEGINSVAVLNGRRILVTSSAGTLYIWDVDSRQIRTLKGHSAKITSVAVIDGNRIICAFDDSTLRLWDLARENVVATFWLDSPAQALYFSSSDRTIAAGDLSGRVRFFDFVEHMSMET